MASLWDKLIRRASLKALNNLTDDNNYEFIRSNKLFTDLSAEALVFILKALLERHYNQGEVIFHEGNPGVCMFIVKSGRVETYSESEKDEDDNEIFAIAEEGDVFGEISVITTAYRTSSAKALDHDTILLTISSFDIEQLMNRHPKDGLKVLRALTNSITDHLSRNNQQLREASNELKLLKEKYEKKRKKNDKQEDDK